MFPLSGNFYVQWRARLSGVDILHDRNGLPPERLLQAVWRCQRLQRDLLRTVDGKSVTIFHPGFASVEGGPDFRGAVVQIGDEPPRVGDIEVDLRASNWRAHGHDRNPGFQNVVLHVVWDETGIRPLDQSERRRPDSPEPGVLPLPSTLTIGDKLDAPLHELSIWLECESPHAFPDRLRGQCCVPLHELDGTQFTGLLQQAATARFQAKAAQLRARAQLTGWEQALWEGLFRGLGYKANPWPMQHLAESRPRHWTSRAGSVLAWQARLLGIAGLLPSDLPRASGKNYLRQVWDYWWRERDEFAECILPRAAWKFHGLRPANHPQRRLALAAHWLAAGDLIPKLEHWCVMDLQPSRMLNSLHEIFEVKHDEFWSWHWTFRSPRLRKPRPLLGSARMSDLAVNVVLPWLWVRAMEGKNHKVQDALERRYFAWPPCQDNSVLRLARLRLLDSCRDPLWRNAAVQQGLMQITQDFCSHSNALCTDCHFPELARQWRGPAISGHPFSQMGCS